MPHNALTEVERVLVQFCFFTPLAFLVIYTAICPWWKTVFGRVTAMLAFVFVAVLLRSELILWGVLPPRDAIREDWLAWFSVACLALAPVAFLTLTWQLVRKPVQKWRHWMKGTGNGGVTPVNPMAPLAPKGATLDDYVGKLRAERAVPGKELRREAEKELRRDERLHTRKSGKDVGPAGDVDSVDGGA